MNAHPSQKNPVRSLHWCYRLMERVDQLKTFLQATLQYYIHHVWMHMQEILIHVLWLLTEQLLSCYICYLIILSFHYILWTELHDHTWFFSFSFLLEYLHDLLVTFIFAWHISAVGHTSGNMDLTIPHIYWPLPTTSK